MNQEGFLRYVSEIIRNNICWRITDSDLSLLPWSWGLCVFVEQLCPLASRQVSRHLKGRSVWHTSSGNPPPHLPHPYLSFTSSISLLFPLWYSMLGIHGLQTKQANKQNNRKTHHPDKVGLGLRERWGEILFAFRASSISLWWRRRPPRTRRPTLLFDFQGGDQGGPRHWHIIFWPNTQLAAATGPWPLTKLALYSLAVVFAFIWATCWCGIQLVAFNPPNAVLQSWPVNIVIHLMTVIPYIQHAITLECQQTLAGIKKTNCTIVLNCFSR